MISLGNIPENKMHNFKINFVFHDVFFPRFEFLIDQITFVFPDIFPAMPPIKSA